MKVKIIYGEEYKDDWGDSTWDEAGESWAKTRGLNPKAKF